MTKRTISWDEFWPMCGFRTIGCAPPSPSCWRRDGTTDMCSEEECPIWAALEKIGEDEQ